MSANETEVPRLTRVPSGLPGMDTVLEGGFFQGCVYIVQGTPGVGKTIFANQVSFAAAERDQRALYVTLLSETHERMMQSMRSLAFFRSDRIPSHIYYVSGFRALEEEGIKGLSALLRREMRAHDASVLVLDGLVSVEESAETGREFKKFIHDLQVQSAMSGYITFLLTSTRGGPMRPEHTMVDGIFDLGDELIGYRAERYVRVAKFRGSGYLRGRHAFQITDDGIRVHPRLEAWLGNPPSTDPCKTEKLGSGIGELDRMLGGGFPCGSTTMILGPSGSGKTTLGLEFLAGCSKEEPGVLFGFFETPQRILLKAKALGIDLESCVRTGTLEILWQPPTENILDALGGRLVEAVRRMNARRVFVDGLTGIREAANIPERLSPFFSALSNELRVRNASALYTYETKALIGEHVETPLAGMSMIAENLILLRFGEQGARVHRLLSVLKVRDGDIDTSIREFEIRSGGTRLGPAPDASRENVKVPQPGGARSGEGGSDRQRPTGKRTRANAKTRSGTGKGRRGNRG